MLAKEIKEVEKKDIHLCTMSGCNETTTHSSKLCERCRQHVFREITNVRHLNIKKPSIIDTLWDMLPSGSSISTRLTSFGEITKDKLKIISEILGLTKQK